MPSFQAKIRGETSRNKNYRSVPFQPDAERKFQKNRKKFTKYRCGFIYGQNRLERAEKDRKQKLSFRFVPT